jgi:phosphate-selective porin OprO/OprP
MFAGALRWTSLVGLAFLVGQGISLGQQNQPGLPNVQNIPAAVAADPSPQPEGQLVSATVVDEKTSLEARVAELEKAVKQAQENNAAETAAPSQPAAVASPICAGWNDGFFVQSPDKSYVLRITGQIQADYRAFLNSTDQTDVDEFLLRRARLGIEATLLQYYEFRLLPDFAGNSGSTLITDAYMNVHYCDEIQVEVGKFKQPLSYEQLIQDRYVPLMERSMIDQLVPARDVGAMIHGRNLCDGRMDYAIAVSNGEINGNAEPTISNSTLPHDNKDMNARIAFRPFGDPDGCDMLRHLQFGISGGWGVEDEAINSTDLSTPQVLKTPATVQWYSYKSGILADGLRTRLSPELAYFYHSLGFAAQYYHEEQKIAPSTAVAAQNVDTDGFYVMATYLLTGEERFDYTQQIDPIRPFNPHCAACSPGAWELVFRVSRLDMDKGVLASTLAAPGVWSSGATESTFGVNWYLNKWVRTQLNWEHAWFDDPIAPLAAAISKANPAYQHQDTLYARAQIIF